MNDIVDRVGKLLSLFLLLFHFAFAQSSPLRFERLSTEHGLSNSSVYCIFQDSRGFIWFGTENGLNRYDGYTFKKFVHVPGDATSLSNSFVWSIIEDHTGVLWIGTVEGLNRFDRTTETFAHYFHDPADTTSLSSSYIRVVYEDHAGTIWVGTTNGLSRFDRDSESFHSYNRDESGDDMDDSYTLAIYEDRDHTIWVGTGNGLFHFDRQRDRLVRDETWDQYSPYLKSVTAIFQDLTGTYWLSGFGGGVIRKFSQSDHFNRPTDPAIPQVGTVRAFCSDHAGRIWGAWSNGLMCFDPRSDSTTHFERRPGDDEQLGALMDVMIDSSGMIWTGGPTVGAYKLYQRSRQFKQYRPFESGDGVSLDKKRIVAIAGDDSGRVFLGTPALGLYQSDHESRRCDRIAGVSNLVNSLYVDKAGSLWIGGGSTVAVLGNDFNAGDELTITFCIDMREAHDYQGRKITSIRNVVMGGSLPPLQWPDAGWPAGDRDKLTFLNDSGRDGDEIPHDGIWSKTIDFRVFWPITIQYKYSANWDGQPSSGANIYEAGYGDDHFLHLPSVTRKGVVRDVFGKMGDAVLIPIDGGDDSNRASAPPRRVRTLQFLVLPEVTAWRFVNGFLDDRSGDFWIVSDGAGLIRVDRASGRVIKSYLNDRRDPTSLSSNKCKTVFEDASGDLWIATWGGGLNRFERSTNSFVRYLHDPDDKNSLNDNLVMALFESPAGVLWVGTSSGGLNRFELATKKFSHFTMADGLPSNNIYAVTGDDSGNLWISTDNGLSKMSIAHGTFRNYDTKDGLPTTEFNERAWFKSKNGELFFGAQDKLIAFFPDSLKDNTHVPPVVITGFQIFNKPAELDTVIAEKKHIVLSHDHNFVAFEFAALNYQISEKNQYRYKLEGNDDSWIDAGARRLANYTNLSPGEYVFRVIGSNNDGYWNETGASIRLAILPPWWRTNWAYAIYALLIGTASYVLHRLERHRFHTLNELKMQRFEAEKLRELDQAKSRFFANISHEFRTPLTLILGPVERMLGRAGQEETREELTIIQRNARRLLRLINQLLDLSKLEAGRMKLQAKAEDVKSALRVVVLSFASLAERKRITLEFNEPQEEITAYLDRDKFEKIISNLLSNAFKFTPEGGKISVQLSVNSNQSSVKQLVTDHCLLITVRDTGVGISADEIHRIFDRFYQVDGSHTREHEGTGIGLALTKELVELHGGRISVKSEVDKGSEFTVLLPLGRAHLRDEEIVSDQLPVTSVQSSVISDQLSVASDQLPVSSKSEIGDRNSEIEDRESRIEHQGSRTSRKPLILIIDDNLDMRRYMQSHLNNGYRIIEAGDGVEGLAKAVDKMPDLVISDVMMPRMDGIELCRKLKTDERTSHIPVILLTAKASGESKVEGLEIGADDYITKPFDAKELQVRVKNLIEQRRKLRERFRREMTLQPHDVTVNSMDEQFLQRALDIVEQHLSEAEFSVETFSKKIGMSRQHLNRKLRALTEHSVNDFIRIIRLKRAAQLLEKKTATVTEIAYEVGFNNPAYFAECFRKHFGSSPSQYARSS